MNIRKQTGTANTTYCAGRQILYLVVHYTAGVSSRGGAARGCAAWFANPAAGGSADYIVDEEELVQYNPDPVNRYCHAVGGSRFRTAGGRLYGVAMNSNCVSLEICSTNSKGKITVPNDPVYSFTERVLEKAKEAIQMLMQMYGIDAEHVIRHYDVNGKCCPGIIGWNKDSGDESRWEAFHTAIGGKAILYYRVGKAWNGSGCDGQIGAFISLENAMAVADRTGGVTVYDWKGRVMYTAPEKPARMTQAADFQGLTEKERALKALELIHQVDDSGILPSVTAAQWVLESGYCTTDLARQAQNCFGMKCELSGNSWKSVWDGSSRYGKVTQEQDQNGNVYRVWAEFRKYPCIEDSIRDHSLYLLGAKNGSRLRYEGLTEAKDYRSAIQIIKNGGYATDVRYVDKICDIIRRYGLDRYDREKVVPVKEAVRTSAEQGKEAVAENIENMSVAFDGVQEASGEVAGSAGQKLYIVQAGAFDVKGNARKRLREVRKLGGSFKKAFMVKNGGRYFVQTGVFKDKGNARRMAKVLEKDGIEAVVKVR